MPATIVLSIDRDRRRIHRDRQQTEPLGWYGISRHDGQGNPKGRSGTGRMGSAWPLVTHMPSGLTDLTKAIYTTTEEQKINDTRLGAAD